MRLLLSILLFVSTSLFSQTGEIRLKIHNIKVIKGTIHVGIYNVAESFPKENKEYKRLVIRVRKDEMYYKIKVPRGKYAISVYHDKNEDNKCNQNNLRIPYEAFGFSNNIVPIFGIPTFSQCGFKVEESEYVKIRLIQPIIKMQD